MKKVALYAGTFDPLTNGHYWVIKEAASLFDEIIVAVVDNPEKRKSIMFSLQDRMNMVKESCIDISGVTVISYKEEVAPQYTARLAVSLGATHLIRGMRNEAEFGTEQAIRNVNQDICPKIRTVFFVPPRNLSEVSSSMVKGLVGFDGWREVIRPYVPNCVVKRFQSVKTDVKDVLIRLGVPPLKAIEADEYLRCAYPIASSMSESYHNSCHIAECIQLANTCVSDKFVTPEDFDEILAALHFHDCVYDPMSSENEKMSAKKFEEFAYGVPSSIIISIKFLIEGTRYHACCTHKQNIVNDIDMSILGANPTRFRDYEMGVRSEYKNVPDIGQFFKARKMFLQNLLSHQIFYTREFNQMFESKAKDNIMQLLEEEPYLSC